MSVSQPWTAILPATGPSVAEKEQYYKTNLAKAQAGTYTGNQIWSGYEPLPGWTPFKTTGKTTPAEMVAALARTWDSNNGDYNALVPGDWFDVTVNGTVLRYRLNGRDQYWSTSYSTNRKHHFVFVPDRLWPNETGLFSNSVINDYTTSDLKTWMDTTFYNMLTAELKASILKLAIPFYTTAGTAKPLMASVFPPSYVEAFGKTTDPDDPGTGGIQVADKKGGDPPNNPYTVLSRTDATRIRAGTGYNWYWLRSPLSGNISRVATVYSNGTAYSSNANIDTGGMLPCFCLG